MPSVLPSGAVIMDPNSPPTKSTHNGVIEQGHLIDEKLTAANNERPRSLDLARPMHQYRNSSEQYLYFPADQLDRRGGAVSADESGFGDGRNGTYPARPSNRHPLRPILQPSMEQDEREEQEAQQQQDDHRRKGRPTMAASGQTSPSRGILDKDEEQRDLFHISHVTGTQPFTGERTVEAAQPHIRSRREEQAQETESSDSEDTQLVNRRRAGTLNGRRSPDMRPIVENGTGMKKSRSQGNFHNGITAPVSLPYEPMPAPMPAYNGMLTMPARRPQSPWTSGTARTPSSFGGDLPESGYQFVTRRESAFDLQNVWDGRWGPMPQNSNGVNEPVLAPVSFFGGQVSNYAESVASTDAYIHNFPELSSVPRGGQTSLPNSHVRRDFDYSLKKLMSPAVFEDLLQDHMGRFRFKQWLESKGDRPSVAMLDLVNDSQAHNALLDQSRAISLAIHNMYLAPGGPKRVELPHDVREDSLANLRALCHLQGTFDTVSKQALDQLYRQHFSTFIRTKIAEHAKVRLSAFTSREERGDIGEVFCLTNPRLPDHPIVLVSDGFCRLTGYPRDQIVGRNCRFLQGPSTAPESIQKLRDSLNAGVPCVELLLNYKRDGTPFWNLLCMVPLKNSAGQVDYFIGGQVECGGALASKASLSFLIGASTDRRFGATEDHYAESIANKQGRDLSADVAKAAARHLGIEASQLSGVGIPPRKSSATGAEARQAAGQRDDVTSGLVGAAGAVSSATHSMSQGGSAFGRFVDRITGSRRQSAFDHFSQRIGGAESHLGDEVLPIEQQMERFELVYSKIMLFRRDSRRIIFVSKAMLSHLGFSVGTPKSEFASPLLNKDLLNLIDLGTDKTVTKRLREALRTAIERGVNYSCQVGLCVAPKAAKREAKAAAQSLRARKDDLGGSAQYVTHIRTGMLHLTPLKDRSGLVDAYVALFA